MAQVVSTPANPLPQRYAATQITALAPQCLGSQGIRVGPADLPTPSPSEHSKFLSDVLRLTLWRATGSTGASLAPDALARKRADFGV